MGVEKYDKFGNVVAEQSMEQVFCGNELSYEPEKNEQNSLHLTYAEARQASASQ